RGRRGDHVLVEGGHDDLAARPEDVEVAAVDLEADRVGDPGDVLRRAVREVGEGDAGDAAVAAAGADPRVVVVAHRQLDDLAEGPGRPQAGAAVIDLPPARERAIGPEGAARRPRGEQRDRVLEA